MAMRVKAADLGFLVWILTGISLSGSCFAGDSPKTLRAGAYAQDITPTKWPISVNGGITDVQATAAHDPLHARCLVLKNDETALSIVVCDSFAIPRELIDRAKGLASTKTGIPESHILISATHSHSCPTVTPIFQSEVDQEYVDFLVEQIAQGIEQAFNQLEPARIGWGTVEQRSLLFNRRWLVRGQENSIGTVENPFGTKSDRVITDPGYNNPNVTKSVNLVDPDLSFLSVQSIEGRPIALLANYSLHDIGGVPSNLVSADYFGEFAQRITRKLNAMEVQPPFVGILSNGTSADVNNVDFRQKSPPDREPFEQIRFAAELLSSDIAKVCEKIEYLSTVPLKVRQAEIVVGVRTPVEEEVSVAEKRLSEIAERPLKDIRSIYARETTLLARYPTSVRIKVQAMRIGSAGIASCPCETFAETGLNLKKSSPFKRMFTISLANGYNGYLPTPEQYLMGGYETWRARSSYLSSEAEPKIQATLKRLLREVSQ